MSSWSRRTLLASVGTTVLAGCLSDGETPGTETATPSPASEDGTATETPTPTTSHPGTTETPSPTTTEPQTPTTSDPGPVPPGTIETRWPMPAADAGRSNFNPAATGPTAEVDELWHVSTETTLFGPVVADGTLFVGGDDGQVRAFDARRGEPRWERSVGDAAGPPHVLDGQVILPTGDAVVALAASDGAERWRADTPARLGRRSASDRVVWLPGLVVASHGVYWFDPETPAVVALEDDGSRKWRTAIERPATTPLLAAAAAVFVPSGTRDNRFWQFDPASGEVLSDQPRGGADFPAERCYRHGTMYAVDGFFGNVRATAVTAAGTGWYQGVPHAGDGAGALAVGAERVFYTSNTPEKPDLFALSRADGTVEWSVAVESAVTGRPTVANEAVLLPTAERLRCFDPQDGTEQWAVDLDVGDTPVIVDDLVYTVGDGTIRALRAPP
jgi:outer membrane protein assembly factor BamB